MHGSEPAAWDIYAKELWPLCYGHPLWFPEPCPEFGEVHIGDVGYLREGNFTRLFNAMHCADHPLNAVRGVPDGFEVFDPDNPMFKDLPNAITQSHLLSKNIRSTSISAAASASEPGVAAAAGLRYQCSETSGALLMLKKPAHRTYIDCRMHIKKYLRTHISSWLDFANGPLGIGLEEKDIIFVSGHTKTSVWAEAAFDQRSSGGELVIAGGCAVPSVSGEFRVSMSHCRAAMIHAREGPRDRVAAWKDGMEPVEKYDQSIFLNYYKMKTRTILRSIVVKAAAGPHELPDDRSDDDLGQSDSASFSTVYDDESDILNKDYDPVNYLLDYIFKNSDAQKAYATDEDLGALFQDQLLPDNLEGALEAIAPLVYVDDDGVGTIISSGDPPYPTLSIQADSRFPATIDNNERGASSPVHVASFVPTPCHPSSRTSLPQARISSAPSAPPQTSSSHYSILNTGQNGNDDTSPSRHPLPSPPSESGRRLPVRHPIDGIGPFHPFCSTRRTRSTHLRDVNEVSFRDLIDLEADTRRQPQQAEAVAAPSPAPSGSDGMYAPTDFDPCHVSFSSLRLCDRLGSSLDLRTSSKHGDLATTSGELGVLQTDLHIPSSLFQPVSPSGDGLLWHSRDHCQTRDSTELDIGDSALSICQPRLAPDHSAMTRAKQNMDGADDPAVGVGDPCIHLSTGGRYPSVNAPNADIDSESPRPTRLKRRHSWAGEASPHRRPAGDPQTKQVSLCDIQDLAPQHPSSSSILKVSPHSVRPSRGVRQAGVTLPPSEALKQGPGTAITSAQIIESPSPRTHLVLPMVCPTGTSDAPSTLDWKD